MPGILLDIEGTTTPISFVYDVLFPFARRRLGAYLPNADLSGLQQEHADDVRRGLNPPAWFEPPVKYVEWLMDQDRKSTSLKKIQGEIWLKGYDQGELHGEVFPDVPPALERWCSSVDVRIFSSGSILAQKLLFSTTHAGDLTRFLNGYFDTTTGPKNEPSSYSTIAKAFGIPASEILFISDVTRELDAARAAGMKTLLCVRPGDHPQPAHDHEVITTFDNVMAGSSPRSL
jgi:enolase-phosphatase E1